jgi:hypothetical protein
MYLPFNLPRAYNNLVLNDSLLYVTVDYCGLEILNVSDTANISLTGWWNPYNCPGNNWFASPSHTNEIAYDPDCNVVFISTGKSDMMVVDVANPSAPDSCNFYGGVNNNIGTWGVSRYENEIYLSYICTLGIPFASNWTGVKILSYNPCATGISPVHDIDQFNVYPNPFTGNIGITLSGTSYLSDVVIISINDNIGRLLHYESVMFDGTPLTVDLSGLASGNYILKVMSVNRTEIHKIIKVPFDSFGN